MVPGSLATRACPSEENVRLTNNWSQRGVSEPLVLDRESVLGLMERKEVRKFVYKNREYNHNDLYWIH